LGLQLIDSKDILDMSNPAALVPKHWNYCNILPADGLSIFIGVRLNTA
jgi:hypothetical protein